jgi:hypothetical protein
VTSAFDPDPERLVSWLRTQPDFLLEDGLSERELDRAEHRFSIRFPPTWREVLTVVHPVARPKPPRDQDGVRRWTACPDWRRRDETGTRDLIDAPVDGLLFDVEQNGFWWADWGIRPAHTPAARALAAARLVTVPRLVPLWGHQYVAADDASPVFSIVQADLYIPALTIGDVTTGRNQDAVPVEEWPIGRVPFWSDLHAYSQLGPHSRFAHLATGGL